MTKKTADNKNSFQSLSPAQHVLVGCRIAIVAALITIGGCGMADSDADAASIATATDTPTSSVDSTSDTPDTTDTKTPDTKTTSKPDDKTTKSKAKQSKKMTTETATFGGGCFWCTEAVFQQIEGVEKVVSGYCNGQVKDPTYKQVCTGTTGHAEVIQITFDPKKVSFAKLLEVHFKTHDPTTLNKQGADEGTQYRSGIYCHDDKQAEEAKAIVKSLDKSGAFNSKIVTEVVPIKKFYPAEDYHQNYYKLNANKNPYCAHVIVPKVEKFKKVFADILKKN